MLTQDFSFRQAVHRRLDFLHIQCASEHSKLASTSETKNASAVEYRWFVRHPCRCACVFTFLLGAGIDFEGVDDSSTGLVFRLFENFLRLRLSAANAPNPKKRSIFLSQLGSVYIIHINISKNIYSIDSNGCLNTYQKCNY